MKGFNLNILNGQLNYNLYLKEDHFDNFSYDSDDVLIVIEGVLLNLKSSQIFSKYKEEGTSFFKNLEGEFVGFIVDKIKSKIYCFTNFTATRKLFYTKINSTIYVDTDLFRLSRTLQENSTPFSIDEDSMYSILVFGNTLENNTSIKEVKKLCNAEYIDIDVLNTNYYLKSYQTNFDQFKGTKKEAIEQIDDFFNHAVKLEFEKDKEINKDSFALLSGGLDSRMTVLAALENQYNIDEVFCFSQKDYFDERIAKRIAKDYQLPFHFVKLNGGEYITKVDEITKISNGLINYYGGIHVNFAYKHIDKNKFGLVHSGQLGDGILGMFNIHPIKHPVTKRKIVTNERLFKFTEDFFNKIIASYDSEELFLTRNVGYNRAVMGSYLAEKFSYQTSPFMHSDFLKFTQSLPEEWKFNQQLYIEWINEKHKKATNYIWERTLLKPTNNSNTIIGDKFVKRGYNIFMKKILKNFEKSDMTAYEYYYQKNLELKAELQIYFDENINLVESFELKNNLILQFKQGNFNEKSAVLTVLSTLKQIYINE
ncbi:asparagine synthase (glutamine-hydrolysing) [Chishuiella changwenlii]|uniref:asparagine synthase (glutamine-hydrolyzing) n=1 Tax=Chishuiella changwenlii TaxID=1434701 RepID=A0A1M6Z4K5_9FLAO|nr:asparagine synthase-related protein [Chishuiella changwenlii]GGE87183.1 hypothetical protein GCM10010984_01210 [Chishuiella changwenlii]SHL25466.1 asparagine synthase (glutamine-hydrolysing) [Chishuiella changwenlii]